MSAVKISAIHIESPDEERAPTSLRLFANKIGIDFDSAKSEAPTQEIALTPSVVAGGAGKPVETRFVLFQNVSTLDIFIAGNHGGGEETAVSKLVLIGEQITQSGLKRSAEEQAASTKGDWLNGSKLS